MLRNLQCSSTICVKVDTFLFGQYIEKKRRVSKKLHLKGNEKKENRNVASFEGGTRRGERSTLRSGEGKQLHLVVASCDSFFSFAQRAPTGTRVFVQELLF